MWWDILRGRGPFGVGRRMMLSAWMLAMTQLSGINITSYYMTYAFVNTLKFSVVQSRILSTCGSVVYLIFSSLAYFIAERWGRRKVIITYSVGCSLCWVVIALTQGLVVTQSTNSTAYNVTSVVFFFVFFATFGMGLLPVPWIYPTEINSLESRTLGVALSVATNWIMNFMVAEVTPVGIEEPALAVLDHLGRHLRGVRPDCVPLLSGDGEPEPGGHRPLLRDEAGCLRVSEQDGYTAGAPRDVH